MGGIDTSICRYYFILSALFLIMAIYCSVYVNKFSSDLCISTTTTANTTTSTSSANQRLVWEFHMKLKVFIYIKIEQICANQTTTDQLINNAQQLYSDILSLKLTDTPKVLVGFYSLEFSLSFLTVLLLVFFGWSRSLLPSEFTKEKFGRIATFLGLLSKGFPRLMIFFHYIILIILLVMMGQVGNGQCKLSVQSDNPLKYTAMQKEGQVLIAILSILWVAVAVGGWIVRSLIYIEPWYADPEDGKRNRVLRCLFVNCGP